MHEPRFRESKVLFNENLRVARNYYCAVKLSAFENDYYSLSLNYEFVKSIRVLLEISF